MKKQIVLFMSAVLIIILAAGCTTQQQDALEPDPTGDIDHNPFKAADNEVLGSMSHGFANLGLDENGMGASLCYEGGELTIDYVAGASGTAKNIGFLIFVDGVAQPYKFNTTEGPYEYMHLFELEEDNRETPFTFIFTPVTGKQGDILAVHIISLYNPAFIPDMKETQSYGGYHTTLEMVRPMIFNADADIISSVPPFAYLSNISLSTEPVTSAFLDSLGSGFGPIDMEALNKRIFSQLYMNGEDMKTTSNMQTAKDGTLHVIFKIAGHPGVRYQSTLYINHNAMSDKDGISFETVLEKGNVAVIEADIDLGKLEDFNTLYVISVPCNASDFPDDVITALKTESLLLYK